MNKVSETKSSIAAANGTRASAEKKQHMALTPVRPRSRCRWSGRAPKEDLPLRRSQGSKISRPGGVEIELDHLVGERPRGGEGQLGQEDAGCSNGEILVD